MKRILSGLTLAFFTSAAQADVWVFDPSASLDQRFDTNFSINPANEDGVSQTRLVGSLGISRESQINAFKGLLRADALATLGNDGTNNGGGELNSNQIVLLDYTHTRVRSNFGVRFNGVRDTPSRDIAADILDINFTNSALDTGLTVPQVDNIARTSLTVTPNFSYKLSRRSTINAELSFSTVNHSTPSVEESLASQFELANPGVDVPDNLTIDDVGGPFRVNDELDDYDEQSLTAGYRFQLTPISTLSATLGVSRFSADTEPAPGVIIPFEELIPDDDEPAIFRAPLRTATSITTTFRLGYERALSPLLTIGVEAGVRNLNFDNSDLFREDDETGLSPEDRQAALDATEGNDVGFVGAFTISRDDGISRYSGRIGFDVLPSSVGSQVESFEFIGDYTRKLNPLLDFAFRVRAFEPDAISATNDNEFARRFLSLEPRVVYRFTRSWSAAASYRYRRQRSQIDTESGQSHALLFSLKYSPPLKIRDLNQGG